MAARTRKRLRVGLYVRGENATIGSVLKCLRLWDVSFKTIHRDELPALKPGDVDLVYLHGGWYRIDSEAAAADALKAFVHAGGGCIGACCGAYNIGWLGLIEMARMHMLRMTSWAQIKAQAVKHPILKGVRERNKGDSRTFSPFIPIVYFNGPFMIPADKATTMVASYDNEGCFGAILAGRYGKGRVVAFGPHPEKEMIENSAAENRSLPRASLMLHNALHWAARRPVPTRSWEWAPIEFPEGTGKRTDV